MVPDEAAPPAVAIESKASPQGRCSWVMVPDEAAPPADDTSSNTATLLHYNTTATCC
jgi:hypothetical protein